MFLDRRDAGAQLAQVLDVYRDSSAAVVALPRGGIIVGYEIARLLHLPIDIIVTRKIGHPTNPEYAVGAVDAHQQLIRDVTACATIDPQWLQIQIVQESEEAKRRTELYRIDKPPLSLAGKVVVIVDDGMATGLSMELAVRIVSSYKPEKIIVAVPVASKEALHRVSNVETVVLVPPEEFGGSVGIHYQEFPQVGDQEVVQLLQSYS